MKKRLAAAAAVVAAAALLLGAYYFFFAPKARPGEKSVTVQVVAESRGISKSFSYKTDRSYLEELLEEEKQELKPEMEDSQYGKFITGMLGIHADPKKEYFNIKVDGEDASTGVSGIPLEDGKTYTFTLTPL